MNQILSLVAAAVILIGGAYMQGSWTDRWVYERPEEVDEWVQRLDDIPLTIGDWQGDIGESDERQLQVAKAAGGTAITFKNQRNDKSVSVFIVCGRGRYVASHTPDKCYPAAGYNMGPSPQPYQITIDEYEEADKPMPEFYTTRFSKESPEHAEHLRIFWAWNDGESWRAPSDAGMAYANDTVAYKMYVISQMRDAGEMIEESQAQEFIEEAMPILDATLFPAGMAAGVTAPANDEESVDEDTNS
jgi:hypothetical protein